MGKMKEISAKSVSQEGKLKSIGSRFYQAFRDMEKVVLPGNHLRLKHKELIAIGISVVKNCQPCLDWHLEQAVKAGATKQEIVDAIKIGVDLGNDSAIVAARYALDLLESLYQQKNYTL